MGEVVLSNFNGKTNISDEASKAYDNEAYEKDSFKQHQYDDAQFLKQNGIGWSIKNSEKSSNTPKHLIFALLFALVALTAVAVALAVVVSQQNDDDNKSGRSGHSMQQHMLTTPSTSSQDEVCMTKACVKAASQFIEAIDTSANPCDDFFQYACGTWRKKHVIPEDKSITGVFYQVDDDVSVILNYLLAEEIKPSDINAVQKAKSLYQSCVNEERLETVNLTAVYAFLKSLNGWPVLESSEGGGWLEANYKLETLLINVRQYSNSPAIFDMYVYDDAKNPEKNILYLDQSAAWGMPSREYYLKGRKDPILMAYEQYAIDVAVALGANPDKASEDMKNMVDFEIEIANLSMANADRRDENKLYHKYTLKNLTDDVSQFDWTLYFKDTLKRDGIKIQVTDNETIIVRNPHYIKKVFDIIEKTPKRTVANYIVWRNVKSVVAALPQRIRDLYLVYRKALLGTSNQSPRWKTCAAVTDSVLGEAVGKIFLKETFDNDAKKKAMEMINNLRTAMKGLLTDNQWMDTETKTVAKEKADCIEPRIGFPDKVMDDSYLNEKFENYTFHASEYLNNILLYSRLGTIENLRKLRKPVDRTTWDMSPATVNAYYNPQRNQISFPAGILQPPFYNKDFPQYLNYGGIGYVIGHEMTHGFDDNGRLYDKRGNLKQWWSNTSSENFKSRADCMVEQYGSYVVEDTKANEKLNGKLTLGENIADNGGIKESWRAYQEWLKTSNKGNAEPLLPGLNYTQKQLFFLNAAHVWCGLARPKEAHKRILTDPHSNFKSRVVGPLQNNDDFSQAFNCAKGTKMNPVKKCIIW